MTEDLDRFAGGYDTSRPYEFDNHLILHWYPRRIMARARGTALLELGIGHGYSTVSFGERFPRHVVVDGSREVLARFAARFPDCPAERVCAYFETFATDERFDVVVMGFVLEHVDDPGLLLRRFRAFLRPGGQMFVTVPNAEALNRRVGKAAGLLDELDRLSEADLAFGHKRFFTLARLTELVTAEGYAVAHVEGLFLKPLATHQLQQLGLSAAVLQGFLSVGVEYPELCVGILMEVTPCA